MKGNRGAILMATSVLMLSFIMLGLASVSFVGFQGQGIAKKVAGTKAFWIAEAGIQVGIDNRFSAPITMPPDSLGEGSYEVTVRKYEYPDGTLSDVRWIINSIGTVSSVSKEIEVEYGPTPGGAITSTGDVIVTGSADVNGNIIEHAEFDFSEIFGKTWEEMKSLATHTYVDPKNSNALSPVDGITWVTLTSPTKVCKIDATWRGSGVMIVDGGTLKVTGNPEFDGILWIRGSLDMSAGTPVINGAIFVECGPGETVILGNSEINFDREAIDAAWKYNNIEKYGIVLWKEIR